MSFFSVITDCSHYSENVNFSGNPTTFRIKCKIVIWKGDGKQI